MTSTGSSNSSSSSGCVSGVGFPYVGDNCCGAEAGVVIDVFTISGFCGFAFFVAEGLFSRNIATQTMTTLQRAYVLTQKIIW